MSSTENIAAEWAAEQARSEAEAFERAMCRKMTSDSNIEILRLAAETIQRLGSAAQDCKSCARLPECNAYKDGDGFKNCDYKWVHADEIKA